VVDLSQGERLVVVNYVDLKFRKFSDEEPEIGRVFLMYFKAPSGMHHATVAMHHDVVNRYLGWFFRDTKNYTPLSWAYLPKESPCK
jgi:hypothetical protein